MPGTEMSGEQLRRRSHWHLLLPKGCLIEATLCGRGSRGDGIREAT